MILKVSNSFDSNDSNGSNIYSNGNRELLTSTSSNLSFDSSKSSSDSIYIYMIINLPPRS